MARSVVSLIAVGALLALGGACAGVPARPEHPVAPVLVAVFPVENVGRAAAPAREVGAGLHGALAARGVRVLDPNLLDAFLAKHRVRDTSGVTVEAARALREELGVARVLVSEVLQHEGTEPPRFAISARLVETGEEPLIRWVETFAATGDDAPGFLGLGRVADVATLRGRVLDDVARAVIDHLAGVGATLPGEPLDRVRPRSAWAARKGALAATRPPRIAVLPFDNETPYRGAGEIVALAFVRHLGATGRVEVVEPGAVRAALLGARVIQEGGGISLEQADRLRELLAVDVVINGRVTDFQDVGGPEGNPFAGFVVRWIDTGSRQVIASSSSYNGGGEGVVFFDRGRIRSAPELASRMAEAVVRGTLAP